MRCTCDEVHEMDALNPSSENCPVHDVEYDDEKSSYYEEWGSTYGSHIIDESSLDAIYS